MRMGRNNVRLVIYVCDDHRKLFLVSPAYSLSEGSRQRATCNYLYLSPQNGTPDFSIVRYPVGTNWKTYCFTAPLCSRSLPSFFPVSRWVGAHTVLTGPKYGSASEVRSEFECHYIHKRFWAPLRCAFSGSPLRRCSQRAWFLRGQTGRPTEISPAIAWQERGNMMYASAGEAREEVAPK